METKKSNPTPALSQLFFETVMNVKSEIHHNQRQVNSKSTSRTDYPSNQPDNQLPQDDRHHPSAQPHLSSGQVPSDSSGISAESSTVPCESHPSTEATVLPHHDYTVPYEYIRMLIEDATDRYAEASKFLNGVRSYSFMFEFHIQILDDLSDELTNVPSTVRANESASTLYLRLRVLKLHLVWRRNKLLGYARNQCRNEKISPPAGGETYLKAAAEARAARRRQCHMVVLIHTIADLKMKENTCKQRRMEAEAELLRYFNQLKKQSSDGDCRQTCDEFEAADKTALGGKGNCENEDVKFANNQVQQDDNEFEATSTDTGPSCARNGSSNGHGVSAEKETSAHGNDIKSFSTEQHRSNDNVIGSTSAGRHQNDSSNDPSWIESSEGEKFSGANREMPVFTRLKPWFPCIFCGEFHWSHVCLTMSTLEGRRKFYDDHDMCSICGTVHKDACADSKRVCKWPKCRAINSHHSALCPNVEYPITSEIVQAYERRINDLNRICDRLQVCEW